MGLVLRLRLGAVAQIDVAAFIGSGANVTTGTAPFQAIRTGECAFFRWCDARGSELMIVSARGA
jgi:hypothetical protein